MGASPSAPSEPLGGRVHPLRSQAGIRLRCEVSSRGDWVTGDLDLPAEPTRPAPLILIGHDLESSRRAEPIEAAAIAWAGAGLAVARTDLPLHGVRASPKLTRRFVEDVRRARSAEAVRDPELWLEVARQTGHDLGRMLDLLARRPEIDATRCAYLGLGLGALLGVGFCAGDDRVRAVALACPPGGAGPSEADLAEQVARIAPRPILLLCARRDAGVPASAARRLQDAAREPREIRGLEGDPAALGAAAVEAIGDFWRERVAARS